VLVNTLPVTLPNLFLNSCLFYFIVMTVHVWKFVFWWNITRIILYGEWTRVSHVALGLIRQRELLDSGGTKRHVVQICPNHWISEG
jgi:hypothetical protein